MNSRTPANQNQSQHVDLDRHFREFSQKELDDAEVLSASNVDHEWSASLNWGDLLERKRAIMLAAAGSGKTHELQTQRDVLMRDGRLAFFVRLEDLARESLVELLLPDEAARFEQWKTEPQCEAWFLLDAVDELKLNQGKLEQSLRRMRQAIDGHLHRAHIIISSRPSDWRTPSDEALVRQWLPIPETTEVVIKQESSAEAIFVQAISRSGFGQSNESKKEKHPQNDGLITVLLLPLADRHIKAYTKSRGVADADRLFAEIEKSNAWIFARRPLDLDDLISLWKTTGKLGTREEQHANNVRCKLRDDPERPDSGVLTDEMANDGAERLALAMTLMRCRTAKSPGSKQGAHDSEHSLDTADILHGWTVEQRATLLRRPIFDPATFGRVRFHHRSVHEYLAARRLFRLREKGMSLNKVFRLLLGEKYGERVIIPSMRPVAAWLSLWDSDVSREVVKREPDVLIEHGDPGSLSLQVRTSIIEGFVNNHAKGGWRGFRFPMEQIERIARSDLATVITRCWGKRLENAEVRNLLLSLIHKGSISECAPIAYQVALDASASANDRVTAIRALIACEKDTEVRAISRAILSEPKEWPLNVVNGVVTELFPAFWTCEQLVQLISRHESKKRRSGASDGTAWALRAVVHQPDPRYDDRILCVRLAALIRGGAEPGSSWYNIKSHYESFCSSLATLCLRVLEKTNGTVDEPLLEASVIACHLCDREASEESIKELRGWFSGRTQFREQIFWLEVQLMDLLDPSKESWDRFFHAKYRSLNGSFIPTDRQWVEKALFNSGNPGHQEVALHAWIDLWAMAGRKRAKLSGMRSQIAGIPSLMPAFDSRTQKPKDSESIKKYERESKRIAAEQAAKEAKRINGWKRWRTKMLRSPADYFTAKWHRATTDNLYRTLDGRSVSSGSHAVWSHANLVEMFNADIADRSREAFKREWRTSAPEVWTERLASKREGIPYLWVYGLCGVMAEAETPGWARLLTAVEARLATRLAMVEINGFAPFIKDLATDRPCEVDAVLGVELSAQLELAGTHSHLPALQDLTHADQVVKELMKPRLMSFLSTRLRFAIPEDANHWPHNIGQLLGILAETVTPEESTSVGKICLAHLNRAPNNPLALTWLLGVFRFVPEQGVKVFTELLTKRRGKSADDFAMQALATLFGGWDGIGLKIKEDDARAAALGDLIRCAYRYVRPEDDAEHEGAYSPDTRDEAERARSFLLSALIETPGPVAQRLLMKFASERSFRHFPDRLRHLARERAAKDAEYEPWSAEDIAALDRTFECPPSKRDELFQVMVDRLEDLQHDILHHDFTNRKTLMKIRKESEMQREIALKLDLKANGAYAVAREEEVADDKKTDIRLLADAGSVKAAIEIKIADNRWTLKHLEDALHKQLVGQYLRHRECRAGCLLLTDNGSRKTWSSRDGSVKLSFEEVIIHLNQLASRIESRRGYDVILRVVGLKFYPS
ncbi:MAG: hypothetical protein H7A55_17550 [Verrucomicrobiaceae bacterium]|nr:hypothetical protein [Verrucomicrobiaceae bacterium]